MGTINTIKGIIDSSVINKICIHEHLLIDMTHEAISPTSEDALSLYNSKVCMDNICLLKKNPYLVYENLILDNVKMAVDELKYAEKAGVNLFIDLTSIGLGRNIVKLQDISNATNVNIVVGCGLFVHDSIPAKYANWSVEQISDLMLDEIQNGIEGTKIKPGIIGEIGTSEKVYQIEEKSLHAAAKAYDYSKLSVMVHTYPWSKAGLYAAQILLNDGVPAKKICVCHVDVTFNYDYIIELLKLGVYIEFDDFGKEFEFEQQAGAFAGGPFEKDISRVHMLKRLCEEGYTNRILLANDVCMKSLLRAFNGNGYYHVFTNIIPMMSDQQINEKSIRALISDNPYNFLFDK